MSLRVLIVDDDEIVVFLHELVIVESGLADEPLSFADGKAALDYLNKNSSPGEQYLVFLDINMPLMNGWQLLDAVQESAYCDQVSVVMVTSSIDARDSEKAKDYSLIIDYLEKPINMEVLSRVKKSLL
jgi:CheY-like chemotaxis protein